MTRFIVDAQLPPALASWLTERGHPAEHVQDRGLAAATDMAIWIVAFDLKATIITKDKDFAQLRRLSREGPPIVRVRLANTRRETLLSWFDRLFLDVLTALERGELLIELA